MTQHSLFYFDDKTTTKRRRWGNFFSVEFNRPFNLFSFVFLLAERTQKNPLSRRLPSSSLASFCRRCWNVVVVVVVVVLSSSLLLFSLISGHTQTQNTTTTNKKSARAFVVVVVVVVAAFLSRL